MKEYKIAGDIGGIKEEELITLLVNIGFNFKKKFFNGYIWFVKDNFELTLSLDSDNNFLFNFYLGIIEENELEIQALYLKNIFETNSLSFIIEVYNATDNFQLIKTYRNWPQ